MSRFLLFEECKLLMDKLSLVREETKKLFFGASGSHDWDHTLRVYNLCKHIGEKEGADMKILLLAALLHDIGRGEQDKSKGEICHAELGTKMAPKILEKHGFDSKTIDSVVHCIERHRFKRGAAPESLEAKVLFDADKLDSIGAIGIARSIHFSGEHGAKVHNHDHPDIENTKEYSEEDTAYREFNVKLKKVKDRMLTEEGKRIAEGRHEFMISFFNQINREVDGEL